MMPLQRGVLTAYAHDMVRIENTFLSSGVFERFTFGGVTDDNARETPDRGTRKVTVAVGGATFAHAFLDDRVSVGAGISVGHLNLDASFTRFGFESLFGPVRTDVKIATATQESGDFSAGWNAGILVKAPRKVKIGATTARTPVFVSPRKIACSTRTRISCGKAGFEGSDVFGAAWSGSRANRSVCLPTTTSSVTASSTRLHQLSGHLFRPAGANRAQRRARVAHRRRVPR